MEQVGRRGGQRDECRGQRPEKAKRGAAALPERLQPAERIHDRGSYRLRLAVLAEVSSSVGPWHGRPRWGYARAWLRGSHQIVIEFRKSCLSSASLVGRGESLVTRCCTMVP